MTAGQLRELIGDVPDRAPVVVETIVGGDLGTTDVLLVDVRVASDADGPYLRLLPDPADEFGTRALIDHALAARETVAAILDEHGDAFAGKLIHQRDSYEDPECVDDCTGCAAIDVIRSLRELAQRHA